MSNPDIPSQTDKNEELCVQDVQEPPAPFIQDSQEPPQTLKAMDQKKETVGKEKVHLKGCTSKFPGCQEEVLPQLLLSLLSDLPAVCEGGYGWPLCLEEH